MGARATAQLHEGITVVGKSGRGRQRQGHIRYRSACAAVLSTQSSLRCGAGCCNVLNSFGIHAERRVLVAPGTPVG